MKRRKWVVIPVLLVLAAGIALYVFFQNRQNGETIISVSGNIEATTVDVSFKIPGKIDKILVEEGDLLKEGQIIATLEHKDLLAQKARAEATLESTQSRIPATAP